jgi:hypothetical protein
MDKEKGYIMTWGEGAPGAGEVGLAAIFNPRDFAGFAENELDRFVKLAIPAGEKRTHWIYGGWNKGLTAPQPPQAEGWAHDTAGLAARLLAPVKIQIKAQ